MRTITVQRLVMLGFAVVLGGQVCAQTDYPNRRIELIVPFPTGGPNDTAARIIHPLFSAALGVPVLIVNRPGLGGAIAAEYTAKASPDGYTLFFPTNTVLTILPAMQPDDVKDRFSDFVAIASTMADFGTVTSRSDAPWKTLEEMVNYARKNPGKLSYGSAGVGTLSSFAMEILKTTNGVDITHVPFQGTGPVKNAILGGHVQLVSGGFSSLGPLIKSGDIKALFTTSPRRIAAYPDVPTATEKGLPEATINLWVLLAAPAGTPVTVVNKLAGAMERAMKDPSVISAVENSGMVVDYHASLATQRMLESERELVKKVVQKLNIGKK